MNNIFCKIMRCIVLVTVAIFLPACSYIPWFGDDEEIEIEVREPLELSEFAPEVHLQRHWSVSLGGDADEKYARLQPHVFGDKIAFASTQGTVSVFGISDGKSFWSTKAADSISSGVGGNSEYLVIGTLDGAVIALDSQDGAQLWSINVASEVVSIAHVSSELVVVRTNDNSILGLSLSSGERVWTVTQTPPALTLRGGGLPVVKDGIAYAGMDNGKVVAISTESGNVLWESRVSVPSGRSELERLVDVDGQLAIDESFIYAASYHGRVVAIDRSNGRISWARDLASIVGVAVDDNLVYVTDRDDNVWALEKATGISSWKQEKLLYRELSAPLLQADTILIGDFEGYLHVLSKEDGRIVGRTNFSKNPIQTSALSTLTTSYVVDSGGKLAAYSISPAN